MNKWLNCSFRPIYSKRGLNSYKLSLVMKGWQKTLGVWISNIFYCRGWYSVFSPFIFLLLICFEIATLGLHLILDSNSPLKLSKALGVGLLLVWNRGGSTQDCSTDICISILPPWYLYRLPHDAHTMPDRASGSVRPWQDALCSSKDLMQFPWFGTLFNNSSKLRPIQIQEA